MGKNDPAMGSTTAAAATAANESVAMRRIAAQECMDSRIMTVEPAARKIHFAR